MIKVSMNINDIIKVKLTDKGKEIIQKDYARLISLYPTLDIKPCYVEDEDGYIEFQMWDFMRLYGSHFYVGCPQLIVQNEIVYEVK